MVKLNVLVCDMEDKVKDAAQKVIATLLHLRVTLI